MSYEDPKRPQDPLPPTEADVQPDPMLRPRRNPSVWTWITGIVIIAIFVVVFYGMTTDRPQITANAPSPAATTGAGPSSTPTAAPPVANGQAPANANTAGQSGAGDQGSKK